VNGAGGPLKLNGQGGNDTFSFRNFTGTATIDGGPGNDTIAVAQGTLSTSQVPFTSVENLAVTGGRILVVGSDGSPGIVLAKQGTLELRGGTPTVSNRVEIQALGILTGSGTVSGNVINAGQVQPGGDGAVGRLTIRGDYSQAITGRLNIDLLGPAPGSESD